MYSGLSPSMDIMRTGADHAATSASESNKRAIKEERQRVAKGIMMQFELLGSGSSFNV
jgi:hypothetical protein